MESSTSCVSHPIDDISSQNLMSSAQVDTPCSKHPPKSIHDSYDFVADVIGEFSLYGKQISCGAVLGLIDILAGRIGARHCGGMIATAAFDHVEYHGPIFHQDLIQAEGHIISSGRSSMVIRITVNRYDLSTRKYQLVQTSLVTVVAILSQGLPNKNIPSLIYEPHEEHWKKYFQLTRDTQNILLKRQQELDDLEFLTCTKYETEENRLKTKHLSIQDTQVVIRHTFMPRDLNMNATVFGGQILLLMERIATQCARAFTSNYRVSMMSIDGISFKRPIWSPDPVEMIAKVVFVSKTTLEVDIEVNVTRWKTGETYLSNTGYFTISNRDENNNIQNIATGIKLSDDDQPSLRTYAKARARQEIFRQGLLSLKNGLGPT